MNMKSFLIKLCLYSLIGALIGVPIGLLIAFLPEGQDGIFIPLFLLLIAAALIFIITYTILKYKKFSKEVNRLINILYIDIDVDKYIKETQGAISKMKNKQYKLHLSLNLAIGFEAKGEYQKAIDYTERLNIDNANWVYKALYYNNLAFYYCEAGKLEQAIEEFSDGAKFIEKLLKNPLYCAAPLQTKAVIEYHKGNLPYAEELLEKSKQQIRVSSHLISSVNLYEAKIYLQTNRIDKAKLLLEYNLSQKLLPNILEETKKLFHEIEQH